LLLLMLGIRWFFGLAGFLGLGATGRWEASNLSAGGGWVWFGDDGIITAGLALAFWSFVGIEFACSLAEEVRDPRKSMPRGVVLGLLGILATSLIMGLGVTGTESLEAWRAAAAGPVGHGGDAPQLAVGRLMFGRAGYLLMALASVAATLGTLTVALATMPRLLYGIARDGNFFGPASRVFARLHPRFGTPVAATIFTFVLYTVPALASQSVIDWLYSAAYVWIILYVIFHILAVWNRIKHSHQTGVLPAGVLYAVAGTGTAATVLTLYFAFAGGHLQYGLRALLVLLAALGVAAVSHIINRVTASMRAPESEAIYEI
jgi:amino acid transporter